MDSLAAMNPFSAEEGDWTRDMPQYSARREELLQIVKARSFRQGTFTLSSGEVSNLYFNMKQTMMYPRGAELAAREFLQLAGELQVTYVSGLEMGAVPVIGSMAALSSASGAPIGTTFVRKRAKEHGTKDVIEGLGPDETLDGKSVLVIDDVSTTGKSILQAVVEIRGAGGIVKHAACLVDRDEGGRELLANEGVILHGILHIKDFVRGG